MDLEPSPTPDIGVAQLGAGDVEQIEPRVAPEVTLDIAGEPQG